MHNEESLTYEKTERISEMKKLFERIFIDGLGGMALGLFSTLIVGTILQQVGNLINNDIGTYVFIIGKIAIMITGAGIGVGVASKFREGPLVTASAAVVGMVGAFAGQLSETMTLSGPGEPLGAFVAAYIAIEVGHLVAGKTKLDIVLTPIVSIGVGSTVGILLSPPISNAMKWMGQLVNVNVDNSPIVGGIIVSVLMGIILTLPISSAAIGVSLGLSGLAAGVATVGCCCQMVGFAVASYRDNKVAGLIAQGVGTSMLQIPNILRKPLIWIPPILASAILAPVSTVLLKMTSNAVGSGMGSAGLVGQIMAYETMAAAGGEPVAILIQIVVMHFILPGVLTLAFAEGMRKMNLIKNGDMLLKVD